TGDNAMDQFKYLFVAAFSDGSTVQQQQPPTDVSKSDPTKSDFFDVLSHPLGQPVTFALVPHLPPLTEAGVKSHFTHTLDLKTGEFSKDGVTFRLKEEPVCPP